jgi:hypothetical protein
MQACLQKKSQIAAVRSTTKTPGHKGQNAIGAWNTSQGERSSEIQTGEALQGPDLAIEIMHPDAIAHKITAVM